MLEVEILQKIHSSEDFVVAELKKVQTLYALKREIRYGHTRQQEQHTESVAEHIYAIHCLIDYFLPLEDTDGTWSTNRIHTMAQYHDIDEIETGDTIAFVKSQKQERDEHPAREKVVKQLPQTLQRTITQVLDEYEAQETHEAKFVKAIDKIEPVFHMYDANGKAWLHSMKATEEMHRKVRCKHLEGFPVLTRFNEVMMNQYKKEGYFC